ncbi:MAG TPA: hypothetical protein VMV51_15850 [Gemmatimonadaceae bacterium]|nr:hypothetical protein [Gemmatimonadaceae bacterium]
MIRHVHSLTLVLALTVTAAAAGAQAPAPAGLAVAPRTPAAARQLTTPATVGPVLRSSAVAARPPQPLVRLVPTAGPLVATSKQQSRAMMIVGGAGLIVGAIIGGTPGTLVMVGGGVVGLVGLYDYLQ